GRSHLILPRRAFAPHFDLHLHDHAAIDFVDALDAGQRHADAEFVAHDLDRAGDAGLSAGAEPIDIGAAAQTGARAERDRAHHVLAGTDAAVEQDLDRRSDRIDDRRQRRDRGRRAVELAPAMIRHDQRRRASLRRGPRILDIEDAFEDEFSGPNAGDPLDIFPAQRLVKLAGDPVRQRVDVLHAADMAGEIAEGPALGAGDAERPGWFAGDIDEIPDAQLGRNGHAVLDIAMALAEHLQIDREHQRAAFGRGRTLDQGAREAAILHDVELKPERLVDGFRDILDRADRHGREAE